MASIVYVTDKKMIENHRLYGSNDLNFWRPLSQTGMKRFFEGDLIFFLTNLDIPGVKEKGVVGYGRFVRKERLGLKTMWRKYGRKNGYENFEELEKAIMEYAPEVPDKLSCLYIDRVVFFHRPVILSEIGFYVNSNLESFTYLDNGQQDYTYALLKEASLGGVDLWAMTVGNNDAREDWFEKDLVRYKLNDIQNKVKDLHFSDAVRKENEEAMHELISKYPDIQKISTHGNQYYRETKEGITVYIPAMIGQRDIGKIKQVLGHVSCWCVKMEEEYLTYHIVLVTKLKTEPLLEEGIRSRDPVRVYVI